MSKGVTESVFELYAQRPNVALLMSGSGSNARAILDDPELRDLYNFSAIATDNSLSGAQQLAEQYGLPFIDKPAVRFSCVVEREAYFEQLLLDLQKIGVQGALYAGFMKITTPSFCESLPGVNVHPADLTILGDDGFPAYRGMRALANMRREHGYVRSSVHVVESAVDTGPTICLSDAVIPHPERTDKEVHEQLKVHEHLAFVGTLKLLGRGMLLLDALPYTMDEVRGLLDE